MRSALGFCSQSSNSESSPAWAEPPAYLHLLPGKYWLLIAFPGAVLYPEAGYLSVGPLLFSRSYCAPKWVSSRQASICWREVKPPFAGGKSNLHLLEGSLPLEWRLVLRVRLTGSYLASLGNNFCFPFLVLGTFLLLFGGVWWNTQPKQLVGERIYLGLTVLEGYKVTMQDCRAKVERAGSWNKSWPFKVSVSHL